MSHDRPEVRVESQAMLSAMIETYGIAAVVMALATICVDRAAAEDDEALAKTWNSDAAILRNTAQMIG